MKFKYLYFILLFVGAIGFVFLMSFYRLFLSKPNYVYAKVKVGQGLWWASTIKPPLWLVDSVKKGNVINTTKGMPDVEVLSVRYLPYFFPQINFSFVNQYDVFLNLKVKVTGNKINGYSFQRSTLAVGAPIDLNFPSAQLSGTVIELSDKPIINDLIKKTILLTKKSVDLNEFDSIKVGSNYFDGENEIIKIVDKSFDGSNINLNVLFKLKKINDQLIFGEEEAIYNNKTINFIASDSIFYNFLIQKIE